MMNLPSSLRLPPPLRLAEDELDARIVNRLTLLASLAIIAASVLAVLASGSEFGVDTAIMVTLMSIATQAVSGVAARRNRHQGSEAGSGGGDLPASGEGAPVALAFSRDAVPPPPPPVDDDQLGH